MSDNYFYNLKKQLDEKYAGITGVGQGYKVVNGSVTDLLSTIVYVQHKRAPEEVVYGQMLPSALDGAPTDVIEMKQPWAFANTGRHRPAIGGISIGHYAITAGTLGVVVRDNDDSDDDDDDDDNGRLLILSNNHVLAASNEGQPGDPIYQPGPADGGTSEDTIATLLRYEPIVFNDGTPVPPPECNFADTYVAVGNALAKLVGSGHRVMAYQLQQEEQVNVIDAAVALPLDDDDVTRNILDVGFVEGVRSPELGVEVKKSGRTTELTHGQIQSIDTTLNISYGAGRTATFVNQMVVVPTIQVELFSQPGDSGSLVLDLDNNAMGLLFAGNGLFTIINPIEEVVKRLRIKRLKIKF